jgi:hypothetical protein
VDWIVYVPLAQHNVFNQHRGTAFLLQLVDADIREDFLEFIGEVAFQRIQAGMKLARVP